MTIVTLSNGKRVANFSSPHDFTFTDGSILPAVSAEESERLKIQFNEQRVNDYGDLLLTFDLTADVIHEMEKWKVLFDERRVDTVYCPLPMINAIRDHGLYGNTFILHSPFRAVRMEDRIKKLVSIDKQCI